MSEPTHCEHGLPFSGDCAECDQPFDRLASVMDEEPSPTPTGESEGERIQCPAGRALNPNVAWRIVGNDVKRPVHLDGSTCEGWRLFPNGGEPSPEEPARASTSMTKRPNVHDFTDQQDYAEALEKWGQSHAGAGRSSAGAHVYLDVDETLSRHSEAAPVRTHPPARASREGDALLTRIEEAIGLASQLGDEAFDYIEGRGLLQERLAIREAIRAIASRLHAAERRSEELERENVEAWE